MSVWNDDNKIADTVVSPSNVRIVWAESMDSVINGTFDPYTSLIVPSVKKIFTITSEKVLTGTVKQLLADGNLSEMTVATPATTKP